VVIVLLLLGAFFLYHYSPIRVAGSATDRLVVGAKELLKDFTQDTIKTTFESKLLSLADTNGGLLEVAVLETSETFRREAASTIRGTTVSEAVAEAIFKFHVPLREGWQIEIVENDDVRACRVVAPELTPSLPVAFKTDGLRTRSSEGWLRWDESEELAALVAQITPELERRAFQNVESAREVARKSIKDFVRIWLLENGQWSDERFSFVEVQFADEVPVGSVPATEVAP
ncbi:MAG: hypothetical protein O3C21_16790, partial [Verrucomicrobia bacterium]|nr:hypothetical protein [Verrucomicrobiota bacterium]